jgi:hypothetical protein
MKAVEPTVDRRRRSAFWPVAITLALLVLYPVSFGPACWVDARIATWRNTQLAAGRGTVISVIYGPVISVSFSTPSGRKAMTRFVQFGLRDGDIFYLPLEDHSQLVFYPRL